MKINVTQLIKVPAIALMVAMAVAACELFPPVAIGKGQPPPVFSGSDQGQRGSRSGEGNPAGNWAPQHGTPGGQRGKDFQENRPSGPQEGGRGFNRQGDQEVRQGQGRPGRKGEGQGKGGGSGGQKRGGGGKGKSD